MVAKDTTVILTERGKCYGSFLQQSALSQELKAVMRRTPAWASLAADQQEALEMLACKISRALNGDPDYDDHWADIAGYATLVRNRIVGE